jgi:hypothetical protein
MKLAAMGAALCVALFAVVGSAAAKSPAAADFGHGGRIAAIGALGLSAPAATAARPASIRKHIPQLGSGYEVEPSTTA